MVLSTRVIRFLVVWLCGSSLFPCLMAQNHSASRTPLSSRQTLDYANGLVGTAPLDDPKLVGNAPPPGEQLYSGFTSPGAVLPHSSTNLAPMNANLDLAYSAGVRTSYFFPNRTMVGFSSGSAYDPFVMPVVGDWTVPPERAASIYDKKREKSSPGYYTVYLDDFRTKVELTVTQWTGLYRFTYPGTEKAHVLIDLGRASGDVEIIGDTKVRGRSQRGAYFVAEFSRPFSNFGTFKQIPPSPTQPRSRILGDKDVEPDVRAISGAYAGAYLRFATKQGEQVLLKIASGSSYEAAEERLKSEDPGWDFERVKEQAQRAWAEKLNKIEVKGGTEHERMLFYSTLFHSLSSPRLIARKGEQFRDRDGKVRTADHDRYGAVAHWDTGRNQVVLLTLLEPQLKVDVLRSELDMARESGYMGTSFHGDHASLMYLGDWARGLDFDWAASYEYLRKNATDVNGPRRYLGEYVEKGWISDFVPDNNPSPPYAGGKAGAATTLEYSWDDYALAQYAKKLGREEDYRMFLKRAHNYQNVFDSSTGFMRGKTEDGRWISPFDPQEPYYNFMMKEASGWSTLWLVPHDVQGS